MGVWYRPIIEMLIPLIPSGLKSLCAKPMNTIYTIDSIQYINSFDWNIFPSYAGKISGKDTFATVVWNDTFTGNAYIKVRGINASGISPFSDSLQITIHPIPVTPIIRQQNDTLYSKTKTGNQWYRDGNVLLNANNFYYVTSVIGNYYDMINRM